jgi:hypothetical protein
MFTLWLVPKSNAAQYVHNTLIVYGLLDLILVVFNGWTVNRC